MTVFEDHPLVRAYLRRFDSAAARLPETRRAQLRDEVADHLREMTSPDMPDAEVRRVIEDLGDPAVIVGEETTDLPSMTRPAWIVGGGFMILSLIIGYVIQWSGSFGLPLQQIAWAIGVLVLALGRHSITARRPLGTGALVGLALWAVGTALTSAVLVGNVSATDTDFAGLFAFGYVHAIVSFVLALIAVVQIVRIEAIPRPWRGAPAWTLGVVTAVWLMEQILGVTTGPNAGSVAGLIALQGIVNIGGTVILGIIAIALGAGVLRRRYESNAH